MTVMMTLADPLPANFDGTVTPTAFTATDGVQTINNHNADPLDVVFQFATDATSIITHWEVVVAVDDFPNIETFNGLPTIELYLTARSTRSSTLRATATARGCGASTPQCRTRGLPYH